jgi:phage baseplate assembly protein W|tara:strand:- start:17 stop:505 length:489 start_codon:yes stop_codon:yes gene_type:complete
MALIKLTDISVDKRDDAALDNGYLYKDLFLDLETARYYNRQLEKTDNLKDIEGLYDLESIKNSIANIFLTSPGQKILNPEFGLDLRRYLFEPMNNFTVYEIKDDIKNNLPSQEPRIQLENVEIKGDRENQAYYITLQINVPSLNAYGISFKSLLNSNGYYIL